jgi:hypothetical protein
MSDTEMIVSHTLALSLQHITRLVTLAKMTGRNKSDLAREALDDLFVKYSAPSMVKVSSTTLPDTGIPLIYVAPEETA